MNRGMYDTWDKERQRRHRIYRAFQDLLEHPKFRLDTTASLVPSIVVYPVGGADSPVTTEAQLFGEQYRAELVEHHQWLRGGEQ